MDWCWHCLLLYLRYAWSLFEHPRVRELRLQEQKGEFPTGIGIPTRAHICLLLALLLCQPLLSCLLLAPCRKPQGYHVVEHECSYAGKKRLSINCSILPCAPATSTIITTIQPSIVLERMALSAGHCRIRRIEARQRQSPALFFPLRVGPR